MENEEKKNANEATSKELAQAICLALSAKKAKDIATVYVREKSSLCDYFVIASGTSSTQVRAMGGKAIFAFSRAGRGHARRKMVGTRLRRRDRAYHAGRNAAVLPPRTAVGGRRKS